MRGAFARTSVTRSMLLSLQFITAQAQTPGPTPTPMGVVANVIVPTIETDHSRYVVGEPVLLRVSVKNETSSDYSVMLSYYWSMVRLTVRDSSGKIVEPQNTPTFYSKSYHSSGVSVG